MTKLILTIEVADTETATEKVTKDPSYQQILDVSTSPPTHLLVDETLVPVEEVRVTRIPTWGQRRVADSTPAGFHWEAYKTKAEGSLNPPTSVYSNGISIDDDGTPWEQVPDEEVKDRLGIAPDWTCDSEGRSNSSVLFEDLVTEIARIVENNRFIDNKKGMARLLLAQLAHKYHLAPQIPEFKNQWEWDI